MDDLQDQLAGMFPRIDVVPVLVPAGDVVLFPLIHTQCGYVSDLIDTLEGNNDRREFRSAINSILKVLHREMYEGELGRWFSLEDLY